MNKFEIRKAAAEKLNVAKTTADAEARSALMAEAKALQAQASQIEEIEAMETELRSVQNPREVSTAAVATADVEERDFIAAIKGETRGQSIAVSADGGLTVPTTIAKDIIAEAADFGPMLTVSNVIKTATGAPMLFATRGNRKARLIAEGASANELTGKLGSVTLGAHKMTTDASVASNELLQDSAVDIRAWLVTDQGESAGLGINYQATVGAGGAAAPTGLTTAVKAKDRSRELAPITAASNNAAVQAFVEELRKLQYDVTNSVYRKRGSYMISSELEKLIGGVKDSNGQYIWVSAKDGQPATLFGRPVIVNDDLPSLTEDADKGKVYALYGDFKTAFTIRISRDLEIKQLNETYALSDETGWVGFLRVDSNLLQPKAVAGLHRAPAAG